MPEIGQRRVVGTHIGGQHITVQIHRAADGMVDVETIVVEDVDSWNTPIRERFRISDDAIRAAVAFARGKLPASDAGAR